MLWLRVSVPLSGLASVNSAKDLLVYATVGAVVSVPLSGLASVNRAMQFFYHSVNMRFRPLIGVSFCKRKVVYIGDYIDNVSVPLSGLASVNGMMDIGLPSQFYSFPSPYRG